MWSIFLAMPGATLWVIVPSMGARPYMMSVQMEVLGLPRVLDLLEAAQPEVKVVLVTDGHTGVAKHVKEERSRNVSHYLVKGMAYDRCVTNTIVVIFKDWAAL